MAIGIENYTNIDTSNPIAYPKGNLRDDPTGVNGTPINVLTSADTAQTFYRALERSDMVASGNPDNATNGYQYAQAFGLESWKDPGTMSLTAIGGGSLSAVSFPGYSKYRRHGKTFQYQGAFSCTVTGTVSTIYVNFGSLTGWTFEASVVANMTVTGGLMGGVGFSSPEVIMATLENPTAFGFGLKRLSGNFATTSLVFYVNVTGELH